MAKSLSKLTLIYPPNIESVLIEFMLNRNPPLEGFTTVKCEGHGLGFERASIGEKVRGAIDRRMFIAIMNSDETTILLEDIKNNIKVSGLMFWTEPVLSAGRLL